ncbi:TPR domain protein [Roseobacter sp. SK209-2-6]|uniref:tetratricopeptide repeat protein n=1 Tax=Roseobacter sp. SK209-2-6 TaxID=388739 RepID=UPI0000F3C6D2|nr:tetratricopeptide repeat protein [Roseobacter sp. SK209-2-6]EBA18536.1 TPR domain protein [Roseobacter sp. SK209-2-6]
MTRSERAPSVQRILKAAAALALASAAVSCSTAAPNPGANGVWAPGVDLRKEAEDGLIVGHRLMAAGQYELALDAFSRAALEHGFTAEVLSGLGSANLGLGRLGQAEDLLRRAAKESPDWPAAQNNLGIVLMEQGETAEAVQVFKRAYALDNGESDAIRDNLRLALEKFENSAHSDPQSNNNNDFKLVRQHGGSYLIRSSL